MWIVTTRGFLSVVQNLNAKEPSDALLVRGRVRGDLDCFADFAARHGDRPDIVETDDADYRFRLTASREVLAAFLAECVTAIDYPNFKGRVAEKDPKRAHVYMGAWNALQGLEKVHK